MRLSSFGYKSLLSVLLFAVSIAYLSTRLSFAPVPWPDGPAYTIPGIELVSWPPQWRMHPQAAFVPEYDVASFNIPPGLPFILGVAERLGISKVFGAQFGARVISVGALLLFTFLLGTWILGRGPTWIAFIIPIAAILDPVMRWGTMAVRTEIWTALAILWGVRILSRDTRSLWELGAALACAAYAHFAGVILVPTVMVALWPSDGGIRKWIQSLFEVGIKTCVFLLPMLIYTGIHFSMFIEQMQFQFGRLSHGNLFLKTAYALFHGFFNTMGSPEGQPKFFNVGKFIFWISIFVSLLLGLKLRKRPLILAVTFLFLQSVYLWAGKPEIWFMPFSHMMFWIFVAALFRGEKILRLKTARALAVLLVSYSVISLAANGVEAWRTPVQYNWKVYNDYVSCIENAIPKKIRARVWQVGYPDVLVELYSKNHDLDLTRSLDFPERLEAALNLLPGYDLVILNFALGPVPDLPQPYQGPERLIDQKIALNGAIPYGFPVWQRIHVKPDLWKIQICHQGPFWAELASPR